MIIILSCTSFSIRRLIEKSFFFYNYFFNFIEIYRKKSHRKKSTALFMGNFAKNYLFTASFNALPGLKAGTLAAAI